MTEPTQSPNTKTMNITRALSTIKALEQQISDFFVPERYLLGITIGNNNATISAAYPLKAELESRITSDTQKLQQLRATQFEIKSKIIESNAVTLVTVNGKTVTVAEAIFMKSTLSSRRTVLDKVRKAVTAQINSFAKLDKAYNDSIQKMMVSLNEAKKNAETDATTSEGAALLTAQLEYVTNLTAQLEYVTNNMKPELFDPAKIRNWIDKEQALLDELTTELDYTLSASNTNTMITVTGL